MKSIQLGAMANVLALEGLEDYDPATHGDVRLVGSIVVYLEKIRGWVQLENGAPGGTAT
jgi:hypothetical protein